MIQRWLRFTHLDKTCFGTLEGNKIRIYEGDMLNDPQPTDRSTTLGEVKLLTPVVPGKVLALWNNFHALGRKLGLEPPPEPLYLIKSRWERRTPVARRAPGGYLARLPELDVLDRVAYRTIAFGFPVWTFAALIAGPIWAYAAWGRYWGWDPKEVWAFITWVVYAAYLHARATSGWKGNATAVIALVGLATLLWNFIGINFFFGSGSQHSYAAPAPTAVVLRLDG
jgi:hypothetical protein